MGRRLWFRIRIWRLGRLRLAPDRSVRLVPSVVGWIRRTVWLDRRAWIHGGRGFGGRYGGFAPLHNGMRYSNIANMRDGHVSRALSAVNAGHFGAGRVSAVAATREQVSGARMMAGNLPVVPSRASLSASGRAAAPSTIRNTSQSFYGSHNNAARPASFQQQTSNLRQSMAQNHVGAIPAGGRSSGEFAARGTNSGMQRPSAGVANRETSSFGNRNSAPTSRGTERPALSVRSMRRAIPADLPNRQTPHRRAPDPQAWVRRERTRSVARLLRQKIAEDSGRSRRRPAARQRVVKPIRPLAEAAADTGIAPRPALRWGSAAVRTPAPTAGRVRNWICTSRSCAGRRMADIPAAPTATMVAIAAQRRTMVDREPRAMAGREHRATVVAVAPQAAVAHVPAVVAEVTSAAVAAAIPAVAVADTPAVVIAKR